MSDLPIDSIIRCIRHANSHIIDATLGHLELYNILSLLQITVEENERLKNGKTPTDIKTMGYETIKKAIQWAVENINTSIVDPWDKKRIKELTDQCYSEICGEVKQIENKPRHK